MRTGWLADLVRAMERPSWLDQQTFEAKIRQPDWLTWNLLTYDLWTKHLLNQTTEIRAVGYPEGQ